MVRSTFPNGKAAVPSPFRSVDLARPPLPSFVLLLVMLTSALWGQATPYGGWEPAQEVLVPGKPIVELTIGSTPYLLIEAPLNASPIEASLWNPTDTLLLTPGPNVVVDFVGGLTGMQTSAGPRVFAWGNFTIGGVSSRLIQWDGTDWDFPPGGALAGVAPRGGAVRNTPAGPELWLGGGLMIPPGLAGTFSLLQFNGLQWTSPGTVTGTVEEIVTVPDAAPTGDTIIISGQLTDVDGVPVQNLARYDGTWDDLAGGLPGVEHQLSVIELPPGNFEVWVTALAFRSIAELWNVHHLDEGVWVTRTPGHNVPGYFRSPGRIALLPTAFGPWVFHSRRTSNSSIDYWAWIPELEGWGPVDTGATYACSFESPSGLFPAGVYDLQSPDRPRRWAVDFGSEFVRSDANFDGQVDLADAISILEFSFPSGGLTTPLPCLAAADTNDDDQVDISDAVYLLGALFPSGQANPLLPPYPDCGVDFLSITGSCDPGPSCP